MSHDCMITQRLLKRQRTMFRLAESQYGYSHKSLHLDTGISLSSLGQYARGETAMSGPAILKLASMPDFPSELLTQLFEGTGRCVVDEGGDDGDHDSLGTNCIDFNAKLQRARSPQSPGGVEIVECEDKDLRGCRRQLKARA